jgi:UDP-N-acetylmuramate: L-alanyl-gamma-D-glutamyl-meso-diaminopimelate ligase
MSAVVQAEVFFSLEGSSSLFSVSSGGRVHVIGVAGVAMAQLAIELSCRGFEVSGSDQSFYEPTGTLLRSSTVALHEGYRASNIPSECDLVVIGNAISESNEEVQEVKRRRLPFSLFPRVLFETVIQGRHSLVVSGTHGKSTSSALAAYVLSAAGMDPSFFIGGRVQQLPTSLHRGEGTFSVVEGDEYDSAFFAKVAKFHFYRPDVLLITSLEYDHADIYPDERAIEREFEKLLDSMDEGGIVVICSEGHGILGRIRDKYARSRRLRMVTYGLNEEDDYRIERTPRGDFGQDVAITFKNTRYSFPLRLGGAYNALNACGVFALLAEGGAPVEQLLPHFGNFQGVARRQEVVIDSPMVKIVEDFAHHPTAVRATLAGLREQHSGRRIVVLFEPRSNTSRRAIFQEAYATAFDSVDAVILCGVTKREIDEGVDLLDTERLVAEMRKRGTSAILGNDSADVFDLYLDQHQIGDVVVVMSNGGFGGITGLLRDRFGSR